MVKIHDIVLIILMIATLLGLDFANLTTINIATLVLMALALISMLVKNLVAGKKSNRGD